MSAVFQICDSVSLECDFFEAETLIAIINQELSENGQGLVMAGDLSDFSAMLQSLAAVDPSVVALIVGFYVALFIAGAGLKLLINLMKRS